MGSRRLIRSIWLKLGALQPAGLRFVRLGRYAYAHESELRYLVHLVDAGSTVVDVGANAGQYAYTLSRLVGRSGRVICVEPQPVLGRFLRRAARQLRLPIMVERCALSDHTGTEQLHIPLISGKKISTRASVVAHGAVQYTSMQVPMRRLDDIMPSVSNRVSLIKIDVEGHELAVMMGGLKTIQTHRPAILVEIDEKHSHVPVERTNDLLRDLRYEKFYISKDGKRVRLGYTEDPGIDLGTHNFLFIPMERVA